MSAPGMELGGTSAPVQHVEQSGWPLTKADRHWNQRQLFVVLLVAAAATWCYVIGEYVGYYLNLRMGFAAMTAGSMIGMLLVTLAVVPAATRYGTDSIASSRPQFGSRGWIVTVFLQYASIIGWNCLLMIFFSKSVAQLLIAIGMVQPESAGLIVPVASVLACAVVYAILMRGGTGLERVSQILFFCIVGVGAWMLYVLLTQQWNAITTATPAYASGDLQWDYVTGIEIGIVSLLSWWPYIGAMVREAPDAHTATLPSMLGMGLPVPILSVVGLAAILALQVSDPAAWLVQLGGPVYGVVALIFVIAANLGTTLAGVYATGVGLRQVPGLSNASWSTVILIGLVPVAAVSIFVPELFFANFGTFLAFIGVFFAPLCAIQIVDYFILRRQRLSIRGVFTTGEGSPYHYWGGFNPAAILAMAAGFFTYLYLLNPITYASRTPYEFMTAALPTALVSGIVYWVATVVLVKPAGKGGY
ncbi:MAG: cytosine/uracil/thiamine/allantoin permease [Alphaproteobacteria bacterium]|nr:MAG: cytosine/uracil/thiamine/allantoin permease [Alphaproteobacteria bacterium]